MNRSSSRFFKPLIVSAIAMLSACNAPQQTTTKHDSSVSQFVDPFIGTGGYGHTFPGATVPHGMVQLSPDNGTSGWDRIAGYFYEDTTIASFSHTHFSGTGVGDLYDIAFMPFTHPAKSTPKENLGVYSVFSHDQETSKPGYYEVLLKDYNIKVELTATNRVGLQKYTFPEADHAEVKLDLNRAMNWDKTTDASIELVDEQTLVGYRHSEGWAPDQRVYFYTRLSKPFKAVKFEDRTFKINGKEVNRKVIAHMEFETAANEVVMVKTALSSVSVDNAKENMEAELAGFDFEATRQKAAQEWEQALNPIQVKTKNEAARTSFYTALYQTMMAPTTFSDHNGQYKGVDGQTKVADGHTRFDTFSLWDTFRALHPLYTITEPAKVKDMVASMLDHYNESGLLPVWSFAGNETNCMIGYHAVPVIVDAYFKGLLKDVDAELAYAAMKNSAMQDAHGLKSYKKLGYVAQDEQESSVSYTLEYAYDDWCIARMAKALGKTADYDYFTQRSQNFINNYDKTSGFMRAKNSDGQWVKDFDPMSYTNHMFMEGNAWQYSWFVPQDVSGLIQLMGGDKAFTDKLDELFNKEHPMPKGGWPEWISGLKGIYVHGNEPSHHVAYLYNYAGEPWKAQKTIHEICRDLQKPTPDGICGNEDCGQMSAWYVFSAMGFYPVNPASGIYAIGTPLFDEVSIQLEHGKSFVVKANNLSDENFYIQSATINGKPLNRAYLTHKEISGGAKIVFEMGNTPNKKWASAVSQRPNGKVDA
ncbi:GH92 family glycosyl hydrolase [Persicobacter psychrovividus]|uniref:Alpha-1 2-mannosidase n=1 Tax=Persicobacter psychrovividus TaxID=387638 RepID=A0ABM7VI98_9BACT|nr:alpha-1 2-mannosidase [Persicobacter psychrovividus]